MVQRLLVAGGFVLLALIAIAAPAGAHPLGNFTINRYARIEVSGPVIRVYYVLDEAEIPTFQDRDALNADRAGFIRDRTESIRRGLRLIVDQVPVPLRPVETLLTLPAGQGGLPTLRIAIRFEGTLSGGPLGKHASNSSLPATFADDNEPSRIGWREIVVVARGSGRIEASTAPTSDVSDELRRYPANLIQAPLDLRRASFTFTRGATTVAAAPLTSPAAAPKREGSSFSNLITRRVTPFALIGMIGLALLFGAGHALAPGHGKTVMAAYLIGTRGRPIDAVLLGLIVSAMHTASVLVLALVLYQVNRSTSVDRIYPWLTIASGLTVVGLGTFLAITRGRALRRRQTLEHAHADAHEHTHVVAVFDHDHNEHPAHDHDHRPDHHDHDHHHHHDHGHGHGHRGHTHELPEDVPPLSRRGLIVLATSGGLLPSPSAVLVLLGAFAAGRAALGLGLVAVFSVGLAVTLTSVGLALVFGGRAIERRGERRGSRQTRVTQWLPLGSAAAIAIVGSVITVQGITRL